MKHFSALLLTAILFSCKKEGVEVTSKDSTPVVVQKARLETVANGYAGGHNAYIIRDNNTGDEFFVVVSPRYDGGAAVTQIHHDKK